MTYTAGMSVKLDSLCYPVTLPPMVLFLHEFFFAFLWVYHVYIFSVTFFTDFLTCCRIWSQRTDFRSKWRHWYRWVLL